MGGLVEPRLDVAACTAEFNVYQLCESSIMRGGGGRSRGSGSCIHPPLYLPKRYSELVFTALGRDARELLFSAYDEVTRDYVVVEMVRAVDAVGGAWLLTNAELVVLMLRARLRHQTLLRVLGIWTPAARADELRSYVVVYEGARQQLSYYLVPYLLLKQTMPHWRLSNLLYQIVWAAHHLHRYDVRLNNVWDVPITGFLYDDDTSAVRLNLKLLVTVARRGHRLSGSSPTAVVRSYEEEREAVCGLGRMLVRYLVATVFGTLDVGAQALARPELVLDRLLAEMRFTCEDDGSGEERFEHWADATLSAGRLALGAQAALLKDFLLVLLNSESGSKGTSRAADDAPAAASSFGNCSSGDCASFSCVLTHPYVSSWKESTDFEYEVDGGLDSDLDLIHRNCNGALGTDSEGPSPSWELPLHALMSVENRYVMFREIKRFDYGHPHYVRSLFDLCKYRIASEEHCVWDLSCLPRLLRSSVQCMHEGLFGAR